MESETKHFLNCLKATALLLIINSHSDVFFPDKLRILATGGALGNGVFFIISGYLTTIKSEQKIWKNTLFRFFRLYTPVYISLFFYCLTEKNYLGWIHDTASAVEVLLWPTPYWFVSTSFMCFVILVLCRKSWFEDSGQFAVFSVFVLAGYLVCYVFGIQEKYEYIVEDGYIFGKNIQFKCIYNFYLFSLGYHIKTANKQMRGESACLLTAASLILFYVSKYLLQIYVLPMDFQMVTHLFVITSAFGALNLVLGFEKNYIQIVNKKLMGFIDRMSSISLEAYIIQLLVIPIFARIIMFRFPFNYLFSICLILITAKLLHFVDRFLLKKLRKLLFQKKEA